jgi:phage antirepressor YoqD-like protein
MPVISPDFNGGNITMSSREIAELVEKRHDNVKRTIDSLSSKGVIEFPQIEEIPTATKPTAVYHLKKRDTFVVVAQLSPEFTARVVDRWQELEGKAREPKALDFTDPQVVLGVITSLKDEVAKRDARLIAQQPKVDAFDELMNADGLYGLQNAGRVLGARPNLFIRWLKQDHLFYQGAALVARIQYIQRGYFEVKTKIIDDKARPETFVTPKGLEYLRGRVPHDLLIGGAA